MADQYLHGTRVRGAKIWSAKLNLECARSIRAKRKNGAGVRQLAREFGVSHAAIGKILSGCSWSEANV